MKSHISKVRIAALAVGLAIVMSSCGIQNQAGDSSSASGKTKNYALTSSGYCYDSVDQWLEAFNSTLAAALALENEVWIPTQEQIALMMPVDPGLKSDGSFSDADWDNFLAGVTDGVPCPAGTTFAESASIPVVPLQSNGLPKDCYPQIFIDETIAGLEQQRDKPDATDAYKAEMQQGIDTMKKICVKE